MFSVLLMIADDFSLQGLSFDLLHWYLHTFVMGSELRYA